MPNRAVIQRMAAAKKAELESRYNVVIIDEYIDDHPIYTLWRFENLETDMQYVPAQLMEAAKNWLAAKKQKKLTIRLIDEEGDFNISHGLYTSSNNTIRLYNDSSTFPHEYGHMIQLTILDNHYGAKNLRSMWTEKNRGVAYIGNDWGYSNEERIFVSDYAATKYQEDIAETFEHVVLADRDLITDYPYSAATEKMFYLRYLLCQTFSLDSSVFPLYEKVKAQPSAWAAADVAEYKEQSFGNLFAFDEYQPNAYQAGTPRYVFTDAAYSLARKYWYAAFGSSNASQENWVGYPARSGDELKKADPFTDTPFREEIVNLYLMDVVHGVDETTFNPNGQITRQEAAVMLHRLYIALGYQFPDTASAASADSGDIADWARDSVSAVSAAGIMNGVDGNRFDPTGIYSYEQTAATMLRIYRMLMGKQA